MYKSIWFKTVATGNVSRRAVIIDGFVVPTYQAKASSVSGGQLSSEAGAGSGTAGAEVDIESKGTTEDASNSPQAHMRVHIHGSWAWIRR